MLWSYWNDIRRFFRLLRLAIVAVLAFRLRSVFVILAVALGIASLALIVAAVDGAQRKAWEIVEWFGPDAAFLLSGDIKNRTAGQRDLTLTPRDALRLRQSLPGAYLVVPMRAKRDVDLRYGNKTHQLPSLVGATAGYATAWNWPLSEGRDISARDEALGLKIGLIGDMPARELFGDASPLGKTIYAGDLPIQIVGRLAYRGASSGGGASVDDRIIIPLSTLTQRFNMDRNYYRALRIKFHEPERMADHVANLRSLLRELHGLREEQPDDFSILTADEILQFLSMLKGSLVAFLGVTAGVAVLAGGFVLANLFALSVIERKREIGLKMALGARSRDISLQFVIEAVLLTLAGGALGVLLGLGLGQALSNLGVLEIRLSAKVLVLTFASALLIGLIFGFKPARQAAALDPIEALRSG